MTAASLHLDYASSTELAAQPAERWHSVLGIAGFDRRPAVDLTPVPVALSMTPTLGDTGGLFEIWRVSGHATPALSGRHGRVHYRAGGGFLFGCIAIDERLQDHGAANALPSATLTAYREIFWVLEEARHPHLIRVWNYLPDITAEADGCERYRQFNSARQAAFRYAGRSTVGPVPAACALGSRADSPLSIYFLAAQRAPCAIENPRQTSAYHYPPKFGSHSPTFSRACVLRESGGTSLFVSGTASIVGHETIHPGDVAAQTREIMTNIGALLGEANGVVGGEAYSLEGLRLKVYVRRAGDLATVERTLSGIVRAVAPVLYLQADACRRDLLVEIEATGVGA